jgi:type IX secretion system PorP/SprF family membrane protein
MTGRNPVCKLSARNWLLVAISFLNIVPVSAQQLANYTQYMNNGTPYNSGFSLINKSSDITLSGKIQWAGIDGAPQSFLLNGNLQLAGLKASTGLVIRQDKFGSDNQSSASLFFAKAVAITASTFLASSAHIGFETFNGSYSQLDPTDPLFRNDINVTSATVGIGVLLYNPDKFYIGVAMPSLRIGPSRFGPSSTLYISAGYLYEIDYKLAIKPSVLISYASKIPATADISTTLYLGTLGLGAGFNTNKEAAGIFSYHVSNIKMGYSYRTSLSNQVIGGISTGTHELSVGFYLGKNKIAKVQL